MSTERLPQIAAACFVVGNLLMLVIEPAVGRILGVPLVFVGIALGVAAIASPDFLERDRDQPDPPR
jgi:hypothetical protein